MAGAAGDRRIVLGAILARWPDGQALPLAALPATPGRHISYAWMPLPASAVQAVIDYVCATGIEQPVHFLWRPLLPDAKDDMVLEAAAGAGCSRIVTVDVRHFARAASLGVAAVTPADFLDLLERST